MELGIKQASVGMMSQKGKHISVKCVGYSEINKYADEIYQKHFPTHKNYGDITKITADSLPDFDLLVGGFPCQSFSIAGKRGRFDDTRGTLFFDIARILKAKVPRFFLLENVKGLLSHDGGRTFKVIISTLTELGYDLQWQVLDSKYHRVPQHRERIFIVGSFRRKSFLKVFPIGEEHKYSQEPCEKKGQELANTLRAKTGGPDLENSYLIDLKSPGSFTRRGLFKKANQARTLDTKAMQGILTGSVIRKFTPLECERLQSFPDGWTEGKSDTQRYKMLGNAVTVNVISDIIDRLYA